MQLKFILFTQYLLCIVSMLLTSMFAINFSSSSNNQIYFNILLMLIIGIGIDLSKYLFWNNKDSNLSFLIISIVLVVFSWCASVSFFVTQERSNIEEVRILTPAYQAYLNQIQSIEQEIAKKKRLAEKRLDSRYHSQWDKSELLFNEIADLNQQLNQSIASEHTIGLDEAQRAIGTSAFFISIAELTRIKVNIVGAFFYAVLSIIIEVSSLSMINLSSIKSNEDKYISKSKKIKEGIINNQIEPNVRLIMDTYKVSHAFVKQVFDELVDIGLLKKRSKQYYRV